MRVLLTAEDIAARVDKLAEGFAAQVDDSWTVVALLQGAIPFAADLMRAQGYVQAQDRFWQMDVRRHATAGRLSELFGETTLETDRFVRTMGWRRVAEQELALARAFGAPRALGIALHALGLVAESEELLREAVTTLML